MKSTTGFVLFIILSLFVVGLTIGVENSDEMTQSSNEEMATETINSMSSDKKISLDMVEEHNSRDDCWMIIQDKVYDVTEYVVRHPGGKDIEKGCGQEATSLFTQRKEENGNEVGSGQPHSDSAESILLRYYIGDLAN